MTEVKCKAACMMTKLNLGHSAHQMVLFLARKVRYNTHRQAGYTSSIGSNHFLSSLLSNQPFQSCYYCKEQRTFRAEDVNS